jgi:PPM family protein phosphatase
MDVQVRAATDTGLKRARNEDRYGLWLPGDPALRGRRGVLLVIADGMGGARAGEVASRIAVETVLEAYPGAPGEPLEGLRFAFAAANHAVHAESLARRERGGMGTTLTALLLHGDEAFLAHVGDSRAYLVRAAAAFALSADHSLVAQLVRDGLLTPGQAREDPRRNVVTRCVGVAPLVEIDAARIAEPLRAGDTLLLTTDGLHGVVSDEELGAAGSDPDLDAVCGRLVALALQRGGPDNITVVAARLGG